MTVTYTEYRHDKHVFFRKHRNNFDCETSPMDEYGRYHKTYVFKENKNRIKQQGSGVDTGRTQTSKMQFFKQNKSF